MRFRMLGPLEIWTSQPWVGIGAPKWRSLLAALLINAGQVVSTDRLIQEIWGDSPPAGATNLVRIYVMRLRRLIGDERGQVLCTRAPGYQIMLKPGDLDAARFDALVWEGRHALADNKPEHAAELLTGALALWKGGALIDVPPSPLVSAEAGRLEVARLDALELRLAADLGCGRHAQVTPELFRLVTDHPMREGFWGLLMQALDGEGRHAEALTTYQRAKEAIAEELGVDPGEKLQRLFEEILTRDTQPRNRDTSAFPPPQTSLPSTPAREGPARQALDLAGLVPELAMPDANGYRLEPDPLEARTPAEFVRALRDFRTWAADGMSLREMARRCSGRVSYSAISKALSSSQLPSRAMVAAIIIACGGTTEQLQAFITARRMLKMAQGGTLPPPRPGAGTGAQQHTHPEPGPASQSHARP